MNIQKTLMSIKCCCLGGIGFGLAIFGAVDAFASAITLSRGYVETRVTDGGRLASVKISVQGPEPVALDVIRCNDGSVGEVVVPQRHIPLTRDRFGRILIKAPWLDLSPAADLWQSNPTGSTNEHYIDDGHLFLRNPVKKKLI